MSASTAGWKIYHPRSLPRGLRRTLRILKGNSGSCWDCESVAPSSEDWLMRQLKLDPNGHQTVLHAFTDQPDGAGWPAPATPTDRHSNDARGDHTRTSAWIPATIRTCTSKLLSIPSTQRSRWRGGRYAWVMAAAVSCRGAMASWRMLRREARPLYAAAPPTKACRRPRSGA